MIKQYVDFARRYGPRFLRDQARELRAGIPAAPPRPAPEHWSDDSLTVSWLGHATVLMNFFGTWLLTDPALRSRIGIRLGPATLGPKRLVRPALGVRELPALDAILLSHAHMDHTDLGTLSRLSRRVRAVVQQGNGDLARRFRRVDELEWGESVEVGGARIEAIPVAHWGARRIVDAHRGYGGFLVEKNGHAVVFGGDTAYTTAFAALAERTRVDLAILPIGAYDPYVRSHANPEQAWAMSREMGARFLLPMHHSTFRLSREPVGEPRARIVRVAGNEAWRIVTTEIGRTWSLAADGSFGLHAEPTSQARQASPTRGRRLRWAYCDR
jgi:L-ascorbate metabolism protein UlaG (beta-lactamase superfamily)